MVAVSLLPVDRWHVLGSQEDRLGNAANEIRLGEIREEFHGFRNSNRLLLSLRFHGALIPVLSRASMALLLQFSDLLGCPVHGEHEPDDSFAFSDRRRNGLRRRALHPPAYCRADTPPPFLDRPGGVPKLAWTYFTENYRWMQGEPKRGVNEGAPRVTVRAWLHLSPWGENAVAM
jgi:hypothetical protein